MKQFTNKQVNAISERLYDWISDKSGDEPCFRRVSTELIKLGLSHVLYETDENGQIRKSELDAILPRLIAQVKSIGVDKENNSKSYYFSLPAKTKTTVYNYVILGLDSSNASILPSIIKDCIAN